MSLQPKHRASRRTKRQNYRVAAASVEFAVTAGIAIMFLFAMLEYGRVSMLKQSVELALYEGGRKGVVAGATRQEVIAEANRVLAISRVSGAAITVTPTTITDQTSELTIRIQIPLDRGLFGPVKFFQGKSLDRSLTMKREGT
jgi:TadE-like protein